MDQVRVKAPLASPRDGFRFRFRAGEPPKEEPAAPKSCCIADLITGPEATHWSRLLVLHHLAPDSRLALYRTCTAARDLILVTAETATAKVAITCPSNLGSLRQVRRSLQTRGKLRTKLLLWASDSCTLTLGLGVLEAGTTWLDDLALTISPALEPMRTSVLPAVAGCCPNLRALRLDPPPLELPSPHLFPKLKEVHIWDDLRADTEQLLLMAAPYMQQLSELHLYPRGFGWVRRAPADPLALPLTPGIIATHLCVLHLPVTLNDAVLGLLLECAPALEYLRFGRTQLETDMHATAQVQWRGLRTHILHLSSLPRLPVAPNLDVGFAASEPDLAAPPRRLYPNVVCDIVGGGEAVAAAGLRQVSFRFDHMVLQPGADMSEADQPAALRVGLDLMRNWLVEMPEDNYLYPARITLLNWTISTQLMLHIPRLPRFADLSFESFWLQGQQLYTTLLQHVPDSFHTITINPGLSRRQLLRICLGAPTDRVQGLTIHVWGVPGQVRDIQYKMRRAALSNVTVVSHSQVDG